MKTKTRFRTGRHTGMGARIQRKSRGWKSSWTQRLTRQFFSWIIFRAYACEKWGFRQTQCLYSLPWRPKLRDLPEDKNYKFPVQRTHWLSRTSCRKFWWFDYSRSQSSQWRLWISKQSSTCNRGAGRGHPIDPVVSVQKKNFSGNRKELAEVLGAEQEAWSHLHWQFLGIWQGLWRSFLESLYVHTTQIGNKWDCWKSSAQSKGRHFRRIVAIRSGWKLVGRFHGMLFPICETFKISGLMGRLHTKDVLERTNHSVWFTGWVLPYFCERPVKNPSIWKESLTWIVPWIRSVRVWNLEGWHHGCRHWGVGNDGRMGNLLEKTQCERGDISQRKGEFIFPIADGRIKLLEEIRNWEHPPWYGIDQFEERVILTFLENQKGLFHHLKTHFRMPVKR